MADYRDIEGKSRQEYNDDAGMSVMLSTEAELDQLVHKLVTAINDIFCPNVKYAGTDLTGTTADGNAFTITQGMKVLDTDNCAASTTGAVFQGRNGSLYRGECNGCGWKYQDILCIQ